MDSKMIQLVIDEEETQRWYKNGKLHRTDGPAVIYENGTQRWYQNNKLHRTDGPAVIFPDGEKLWYLNGVIYEPQDKFNNLKFSIKDGF